MSILVYIGLGSNMGDRVETMRRAEAALRAHPDLRAVRSSSLYETAAWGRIGEPDFVNSVIEARTSLVPKMLLEELQGIERALGRRREEEKGRWTARPLDLDILLYGQAILDEPELVVPHPHLHERRFVLVPLAELNPDLTHPTMGKTVAELLSAVGEADRVERIPG